MVYSSKECSMYLQYDIIIERCTKTFYKDLCTCAWISVCFVSFFIVYSLPVQRLPYYFSVHRLFSNLSVQITRLGEKLPAWGKACICSPFIIMGCIAVPFIFSRRAICKIHISQSFVMQTSCYDFFASIYR